MRRSRVHLVDKNETLRAVQQATLADCGVTLNFHTEASRALMTPSNMAPEPTILIANEFLDALPVYQFEYRNGKWRDRDVGLGGGGDQLGLRGRHDLQRHAALFARGRRAPGG